MTMGDRPPRICADVTALRNLPKLGAFVLYIVKSTGAMYLLDNASVADDDGLGVIEPAWAEAVEGPGRFIQLESGASFDEGQRAVNGLRVASAGINAQTLTIGGDVYELTTKDDLSVTGGHIAVDVHAGATVKAQGKFTQATGDVADTETVTVNGKVYTFQTVLTNVDGHVLIGATAQDTIDNFVAAVNAAAGAGTKYAAATTKHTTVTAVKSGTTIAVLTAIIGGTPGNAYTLASTAAHWTRDAATLGTLTLGVDPSADDVTDALFTTINASATEAVSAIDVGDNELLIVADLPGAVVLACSETLTGSNNALNAVAMYGGRAAGARKIANISRVPLAQEVTLGNLHFVLPFTPSKVLVTVHPTATPGAVKAWDGGITIVAGHVTLDNAGSTDWAATDTVDVEFLE
jgi:hypothetical protein